MDLKYLPEGHNTEIFVCYLLVVFPISAVEYRKDALCRWDEEDYKVVFRLWIQWMKRTKNKCHFSSTQVLVLSTQFLTFLCFKLVSSSLSGKINDTEYIPHSQNVARYSMVLICFRRLKTPYSRIVYFVSFRLYILIHMKIRS